MRKARPTKAPSPLAGQALRRKRGMPVRRRSGEGRAGLSLLRLSLIVGSPQKAGNGWRLSAPEIERTVAAVAAQQLLDDRAGVLGAAHGFGVEAPHTPAILEAANPWKGRLRSEADLAAALRDLVDKVELRPDGIELSINLQVSWVTPTAPPRSFRLQGSSRYVMKRRADTVGHRRR